MKSDRLRYFQYVDMRWGIPSSVSTSHSAAELCLHEVDRCFQQSLATNSVVKLFFISDFRSVKTVRFVEDFFEPSLRQSVDSAIDRRRSFPHFSQRKTTRQRRETFARTILSSRRKFVRRKVFPEKRHEFRREKSPESFASRRRFFLSKRKNFRRRKTKIFRFWFEKKLFSFRKLFLRFFESRRKKFFEFWKKIEMKNDESSFLSARSSTSNSSNRNSAKTKIETKPKLCSTI